MKYLLTEDVLFILPLKYQISRESPFFDEVLNICQNKESTPDQLEFLSPNLNYSSELISIEDSEEYADVFYNGKYYPIPDSFYKTCINLIKNRTAITKEGIALFLKNCLNNTCYSFKELWLILEKYNFNFLNNGNILVYKSYNEGDDKKKGYQEESNPITIKKFEEKDDDGEEDTLYTVIEINPAEINLGKVTNWKIKDVTTIPYLNRTFQNLMLYNVILLSIIENENDLPKMKEMLSAILAKDINDILYRGKLEYLFENKRYQSEASTFRNLILRLCQE
jgi:hypothetical protein